MTPPPPIPTSSLSVGDAGHRERLEALHRRRAPPNTSDREWRKIVESMLKTRDESGDEGAHEERFTFNELWEVLVDRKYDDEEEYKEVPVPATRAGELERLKVLRDRAKEQGRLFGVKNEERKRALKTGDKALTNRLSKDARRFKAEQGKLDAEASKGLFEFYNRHLPLTTIDLHGQHSREAVEYTKERIEALLRVGKKTKLRVITGRGLHSVLGKPILKPTIVAYLESLKADRGINACVQEDAKNAGALIVCLPSRAILAVLSDSESTASSDVMVATGRRVGVFPGRKYREKV